MRQLGSLLLELLCEVLELTSTCPPLPKAAAECECLRWYN